MSLASASSAIARSARCFRPLARAMADVDRARTPPARRPRATAASAPNLVAADPRYVGWTLIGTAGVTGCRKPTSRARDRFLDAVYRRQSGSGWCQSGTTFSFLSRIESSAGRSRATHEHHRVVALEFRPPLEPSPPRPANDPPSLGPARLVRDAAATLVDSAPTVGRPISTRPRATPPTVFSSAHRGRRGEPPDPGGRSASSTPRSSRHGGSSSHTPRPTSRIGANS